MLHKSNKFLFASMLALSFGVTSCMIDSDYDLEDIDFTFGIDTDLTFPACSTGDITLKNLFDLEDEDIVQNIDGDYYLKQDGRADLDPIHIDPISMKSPDIHFTETFIDLSASSKGSSQTTYHYPILDTDSAFYDADLTRSEPISEDLVSIDNITLEAGTSITLGMSVKLDEQYSFIKTIHYDNFLLTLPRGLHISNASCIYVDELGTHRRNIERSDIDNEKGIIRVTPATDPIRNRIDQPIQIQLTLDKIYVGEDITFIDHIAGMKGRFQVDGSYRFERSEMTIPEAVLDQFNATGKASLLRPESVCILGSAEFDCEDIVVKSFTGQFRHEVEDVAPISLEDVPDFLNEEDVVLDLANPVIFVRVVNPFHADAHTSISLTSHYATSADITRLTGDITIPADKETVYYVSESNEGVKIPEEYRGKTLQWIQVKDLKGLLRKVPQSILVDVADITMNCIDMPIAGDYQIELDYKIFTPIAFGPDFRLVFVETERNLSMDLENIDKVDFTILSLSANVFSDMPLDFTFTITPLDEDGNVLRGLAVEQMGTIKANSKGTPVSFSLQAEPGHTINEFISGYNAQGQRVPQFDGIKFRAEAVSNNGGVLNENTKIRLEDIKLRVAGKVTVDESDLSDDDDDDYLYY